jgi:hypothetical protein
MCKANITSLFGGVYPFSLALIKKSGWLTSISSWLEYSNTRGIHLWKNDLMV